MTLKSLCAPPMETNVTVHSCRYNYAMDERCVVCTYCAYPLYFVSCRLRLHRNCRNFFEPFVGADLQSIRGTAGLLCKSSEAKDLKGRCANSLASAVRIRDVLAGDKEIQRKPRISVDGILELLNSSINGICGVQNSFDSYSVYLGNVHEEYCTASKLHACVQPTPAPP